MAIIVWLSLFATALFALVNCQEFPPTPGPAVEQCVNVVAAQDFFVEQCLQHFRNRQRNATSLAVYCGVRECVTRLEEVYTDCNETDIRFLTSVCDDGFRETVINSEFCVSKAISASPALQNCQRQFLDIVFAETQTTPIGPFCIACGQSLGTEYANCGPAVDISSRLAFGPTIAEIFQDGCAQDSLGRYCSDVLRGLADPNRSQLVEAAVQACENVGAVCTPACRDAINALGCCVHLEQTFRSSRSDEMFLPLDVCNIAECPIPFSIDAPQVCNGAGVSVSLHLVVISLSVLLSAMLNIVFSMW